MKRKASNVEHLYRGFSCPQEPLDEDFLALIASTHARAITTRFLTRYAQELAGHSEGLAATLADGMSSAPGFDRAWDAALGQVRSALALGDATGACASAAALALHFHHRGLLGGWRVRFRRPELLKLGPWLLPAATHLVVDARDDVIAIETRVQRSVTRLLFRRQREGVQSGDAEKLPQVTMGRHRCSLLPPPTAVRGDSSVQLAALRSAVSLLRRDSPVYLEWVDRVLRTVVPLPVARASMQSTSDIGRPGVIEMSLPGSAPALAEMLVHESTHQYMGLLCRLGALDDGSDPTLYYSPIRKMGRPIRWIVIAYHAFANVLLLYRQCSAARGSRYCANNEKVLLPQLQQLEQALRATRALTPLGRALWEPLAARIH